MTLCEIYRDAYDKSIREIQKILRSGQRPRTMDNDPRPMPLEPQGRYTGPLCTEREPCDRCGKNEDVK